MNTLSPQPGHAAVLPIRPGIRPAGQVTEASVYLEVLREERAKTRFWQSTTALVLAAAAAQYAYHRYEQGLPLFGKK